MFGGDQAASSLSKRSAMKLGLLVGASFGFCNLVVTYVFPLTEDSPAALAAFYGPIVAIWSIAGACAARRSGRLSDAAATGAVMATATFVVFVLSVIVRANLFLDVLAHRSDWQGLMARYQASGFTSLRLFANYVYLSSAPLVILVATVIGAIAGLVGGLIGRMAGSKLGPAAG